MHMKNRLARLLGAAVVAGGGGVALVAIAPAPVASASTAGVTCSHEVLTGQQGTVVAGNECGLASTATITGNVLVEPGGTLVDNGATINGNLVSTGAARVVVGYRGYVAGNVVIEHTSGGRTYLCATTVEGNAVLDGNSGTALYVGGTTGTSDEGCGSSLAIAGNLQVADNMAPVYVGHPKATNATNDVAGNIAVTGDSGGGTVMGNRALGNCWLATSPGVTGSDNMVTGHFDSCNTAT